MRPPRIQDFAREVAAAMRLAVRGKERRKDRRVRSCAAKLEERARTIDDRELLFCDFELAMHFRVAFIELFRETEQRAGDNHFSVDVLSMMERFFPQARSVVEGLVTRPLHNSFTWMGRLAHASKDTILASNRNRVLKQLEAGTPPAPKTLNRWISLGLRHNNRVAELVVGNEWLKGFDTEEPVVRKQTEGMLTEAMRASLLIADLRRAKMVYDPESAGVLSDW